MVLNIVLMPSYKVYETVKSWSYTMLLHELLMGDHKFGIIDGKPQEVIKSLITLLG